MKKKIKWIYVLAALLVASLLVMLLVNGDAEMLSRLGDMAVAVAIGLVVLLAVLFAAIYRSRKNRGREADFRAKAVAVQGKVIRIDRVSLVKMRSSVYSTGGDLFHLYAEYEFGGKKYNKARRSFFGAPPYKVGDAITVRVNPENPAETMILPEETPVQNALD